MPICDCSDNYHFNGTNMCINCKNIACQACSDSTSTCSNKIYILIFSLHYKVKKKIL